MRVGLVSDTHGRFNPLLVTLFARCDAILHAGDVMGRDILLRLESLAPLTAVRGNNDHGEFGLGLEDEAIVRLEGLRALVLHDLGRPDRLGSAASHALLRLRPDLVVFGHSHRPAVERVSGVLYVNPGSAGARRFNLPLTAAVLTVKGRSVRVEHFDLEGQAPTPYGEPFEATL